MRRRWRESEWSRARKRQKQTAATQKWIGNSFDIGVFLGVDILDDALNTSTSSPLNVSSAGSSTTVATVRPAINVIPPSTEAETFVTAPSESEVSSSQRRLALSPRVSRDQEDPKPESASSSTALLVSSDDPACGPGPSNRAIAPTTTKAQLDGPLDLSVRVESPSPTKGKGKDKHVHYQDDPVPPSEVLARTGDAVKVTSAGAVEQTTREATTKWGDVIMRDRMLVRVSYTEDAVSPTFDEWQNRTTRHLENEGWAEYIVAWRKNRLELYENHHTPGKEWFTGTKRLSYLVPLDSTSTRLSLYSFVDLSFCLSCPPTSLNVDPKGRRHFFGSTRGTNIFIFKLKCRTRAVDWLWHIWRHLGGQLPPYIEVRAPAIDTRLKVDVPGFDAADIDAAYDVFKRDNIVRLCEKYLRTAPEYRALLEREEAKGVRFDLAWRLNTDLDWVWKEEDVQGQARKWAVLCGLALKQADKPAHLEIRMVRHLPTRLHMKDGTRLDEPPAVEGYLDRIRPNSQLKQSIYLVTHDGYLFALTPARAHQPSPPGATATGPIPSQSVSIATDPNMEDTVRRAEVRRGQLQIMEATGMSDLRSIVAVRRAFQLLPPQQEQVEPPTAADWEDSEGFWAQVERSEDDDDDVGGEAGLAASKDKAHLRMRRSFELVLTSGRVVRYEAYSCATALEWIVRLRPLVSYWKKRHQVDARLEMDVARVSTGRERITPHRAREDHEHVGEHDMSTEPPPDRDESLPDLSFFYNWCVLDGCRPILKCGRLYGRKGWWGQYKHTQLVLIAGHLVQFHITGTGVFHHRKKKVVHLIDAYVCSGYFAAQYLPEGQYDANKPPVARRYQDGLETDDGEEDTLFIIWYRKVSGAAPGVRRNNSKADIPPLNAKRKVAIFRTRSRLERDSWVWAINVEIERTVRASREREEAVRQSGQLLKK
ncbi:Pleckstrin homology domain-containing protein [Daedaleopsis nitida]|nr:Pleckstrin homology domain-containing protein [Daedaleopsis nitida]